MKKIVIYLTALVATYMVTCVSYFSFTNPAYRAWMKYAAWTGMSPAIGFDEYMVRYNELKQEFLATV